ncbi:glutamate dehydrogenase (NAD) [Luteococcus japonicus]|uniref:Glutamate dehydrogenase (NAD) n=2 Tax=Propionibacteriaceae TaxID=31957 RepID=A0A3N1ZYU6_9ACTN|nr:glutamate dehydrogenase (NAD) [Luteococcus japonicus]
MLTPMSRTDVVHELGDVLQSRLPGMPNGRLQEMVELWLSHVRDEDLAAMDREVLTGLMQGQLDLGRRRADGQDLVRVEAAVAAGRPALVQVVTQDRPFVVDTIAMALTGAGWSIAELLHPQFHVARDGDGRLVQAGQTALQENRHESWVGILANPPLGGDVEQLSRQLEHEIRTSLQDLALAVEDFDAMRRLMRRVADDLPRRTTPYPSEEMAVTAELLRYLADDRFTFLGYREYDYADGGAVPVPGSGLGILRGHDEPDTFNAMPAHDPALLLAITKDQRRSRVQRPVLMDYLAVRRFDESGRAVGEQRFLGLFGHRVFTESVHTIPVLRDKIEQILDEVHYEPGGHGARAIWAVADAFPREELFHATAAELEPVVHEISQLKERRQVRLFLRPSPWPGRLTALVYFPRDRYNTDVRLRMERVLLKATGAQSIEYQAQVTQSVLARLYFALVLPDEAPADLDAAAIEEELTAATRDWEDEFVDLARELSSEERGVSFPDAYKEDSTARQAIADLRALNEISGSEGMRFAVYAPDDEADPSDLRLKVMRVGAVMQLQDVMPHLTSLAVRVLDERPYELELRGQQAMVYDFGLSLPGGLQDWDMAARRRLTEAFEASWQGQTGVDPLNGLVSEAGMGWRQVMVLRAIGRYLQQLGSAYSQAWIAQTLRANQTAARHLVELFEARFDPDRQQGRDEEVERLNEQLQADLDEVSSLDQDRILRQYVAVVNAIVRTNFFAADAPAFAIKLLPTALDFAPQPRPAFEIFVHSPRVEGVHLRFGSVARGGLRWSDRPEDFRTEVLGLVKAQMVKNTVIVPVGAKGGFFARQLPNPATDRAAWLEEGQASYRLFISSLLSLTDNIVDGQVVPPPRVVRHDADDPYLVVAADKGTATFSDIANGIAIERDFWLGDAFASGGSVGYDHKAMGITARGAWESVKHHFRELGVDCQGEDFTCVGIGDMAGDVFGNGMMLSEHTRLVAAFNHLHIFLDPNPDAVTSHAERVRLFNLPRSTWADYDASLVSEGGGVHSRQAKSIEITPQVREALGLDAETSHLTPTELIRAILCAPVDLLWNGGIGTYVKAGQETHQDVGDKANDAVRVNGAQVRARIAGEGGNLGWTQLGRIEYARAGGRINTDFIDNSAGVDTSDHEVNIKILLDGEVSAGRLSQQDRDALLPQMTDDVAALVLRHNVDQNLALSNARAHAVEMAGVHEDWMRQLEASGYLDRAVEYMPSSAAMAQRITEGNGLTSPELATLLAWSKIWLADQILDSDLPDDPYVADRLVHYFPPLLRERYRDRMPQHRLHREIITTVAVNRFVNSQGMTACHRLSTETGAAPAQVMRAQLAARSIFDAGRVESNTRRAALDAALQTDLRVRLRTLVEYGARWLLHRHPEQIDVQATIDRYHDGVQELFGQLPSLLSARAREVYDMALQQALALGVDEDLAPVAVGADWAHLLLSCVEISQEQGRPLDEVAQTFFELAERLGLDRMLERVENLPRTNRWDNMARSAIRDDLLSVQTQLAAQVVAHGAGQGDAAQIVDAWWQATPGVDQRASTLSAILDSDTDLARMSVGLRTVRSLMAKA